MQLSFFTPTSTKGLKHILYEIIIALSFLTYAGIYSLGSSVSNNLKKLKNGTHKNTTMCVTFESTVKSCAHGHTGRRARGRFSGLFMNHTVSMGTQNPTHSTGSDWGHL